jgi:hypothetical protein
MYENLSRRDVVGSDPIWVDDLGSPIFFVFFLISLFVFKGFIISSATGDWTHDF